MGARQIRRIAFIAALLIFVGAGRAWAITCQEMVDNLYKMMKDGADSAAIVQNAKNIQSQCRSFTVGEKTQWVSLASIKAFLQMVVFDSPVPLGKAGPNSDRRLDLFQNPTGATRHPFRLSLVGEVGFARGDGATLILAQGGIRITPDLHSSSRISPFAQMLVGIEHCGVCQYSALALQPGGGIVYLVSPRIQLFAEADYRIVPSSENGIAVGGGVTFTILKK